MKKRTETALDYLGYALYAFGALGMELVLMMIENAVYGQPSESWTFIQHSLHWIMTCMIWGCIGYMLMKKLPAHKQKSHNNNRNRMLVIGILMAVSLGYTSLVWGGCKPIQELHALGPAKFFLQYVYYAFESLLMVLIIAHGQEAGERKGMQGSLPIGGILLALTWGMIHILTQSGTTGIYTILQALLYGELYVLFNKDLTRSYLAIALIFML